MRLSKKFVVVTRPLALVANHQNAPMRRIKQALSDGLHQTALADSWSKKIDRVGRSDR
jgi:hypothetical protein